MNISVIIPTYKNKEKLLESLRNNLPFVEKCQIIIVNDDPTQSIQNDTKDVGHIELIENKKNVGFGESVNIGVQQAKHPYIMLLNSDVFLNNNSFEQALSQFAKEKNLFAVSFAQKEKDGSIVGKNTLFWKKGLVFHNKKNSSISGYNAWAEGGACIIEKKKYIQLGGFDPLYSPFYWEDIDLSYRAWKAGYKIIFDPSIQVNHSHESTIGKYFSRQYIRSIAFKNQIIFLFKNVSDFSFFLSFLLFLPFNVFYYLYKGEFGFITGLLQAFFLFPILIKKHLYEHHVKKISDASVFKQLEDVYEP